MKRADAQRIFGLVEANWLAMERIDFLFTGAGFWDPQIGVVADSVTWPWPSWCCKTRPYDFARDGA